tara:strand:- start:188 stop:409 length:222 start_codon:yes stop_codon:yes gene_type:complete
MTFAQYCRIEAAAGGCDITPRDFIKAAGALLHDGAMHHAWRGRRHAWLRAGLEQLARAKTYASAARVLSGGAP